MHALVAVLAEVTDVDRVACPCRSGMEDRQ